MPSGWKKNASRDEVPGLLVLVLVLVVGATRLLLLPCSRRRRASEGGVRAGLSH